MENVEYIKELIVSNRLEEAIKLLKEYLERESTDYYALYLLGNAYRKLPDFQKAIFYYRSSVEINPQSPAQQAYDALIRILHFVNPDLNP